MGERGYWRPGNMQRTRKWCGDGFTILSGDDDKTFGIMTDQGIMASALISVSFNITPKAVQDMTAFLNKEEHGEAEKLLIALKPLFGIVIVKTQGGNTLRNSAVSCQKSTCYKDLYGNPRNAWRVLSPAAG